MLIEFSDCASGVNNQSVSWVSHHSALYQICIISHYFKSAPRLSLQIDQPFSTCLIDFRQAMICIFLQLNMFKQPPL